MRPGTPSGPADFLGLMAHSVRLTSCSSIVRFTLLWAVWYSGAVSGAVTSKQAKKMFMFSSSFSSSEVGPVVGQMMNSLPHLPAGVTAQVVLYSPLVVCLDLQVVFLSFSSFWIPCYIQGFWLG